MRVGGLAVFAAALSLSGCRDTVTIPSASTALVYDCDSFVPQARSADDLRAVANEWARALREADGDKDVAAALRLAQATPLSWERATVEYLCTLKRRR